MLRGSTPHDLAKDGDDKKVMGLRVQYDQYVKMFNCSLYICLPVVLTQVYTGTGWLDLESSSVNPRGLPSNSIGMHLKLLHIVRVAHRTDLRLAESS